MLHYCIRRLLALIPTLFIIATLSFFIIRIAPGGPFDRERAVPEQVLRNIEKRYHFDESLFQQYLRYMASLLRADLGPSYRYHNVTVNELISAGFGPSMTISILAIGLALGIGVPAGMIAAVRKNQLADYALMIFTVFGISIPVFVVGPILVYIFAIHLRWLPTSGWIDTRFGLSALLMPVFVLSLSATAYVARLSRANAVELLQSDFIRMARAKGLSIQQILFRHLLKGTLVPVISYIGPAFAATVTSSVVVESIFRIPGLGKFFVQAAFNRDYTLILGLVIVYSILLILVNFLVDILYGALDPRVHYD